LTGIKGNILELFNDSEVQSLATQLTNTINCVHLIIVILVMHGDEV